MKVKIIPVVRYHMEYEDSACVDEHERLSMLPGSFVDMWFGFRFYGVTLGLSDMPHTSS